MKRLGKKLPIVLLAAILAVAFSFLSLAPTAAHADPTDAVSVYGSLQELANKRVGTIAGSLYGDLLVQRVPELSKDSIKTYENTEDMVSALDKNEVDAILVSGPSAEVIVANNNNFAIMEEAVSDDAIGICLKKDSSLTKQFIERLEALRMDGTMDALRAKWLGPTDATKEIPQKENDSPNGTLRVVCYLEQPMAYVDKDGSIVGYEAELVQDVAHDLGYSVAFYSVPFINVMSDVASGKADVGIGSITITEERANKVDFTTPDYTGGVTVVTRAAKQSQRIDLISGIIRSFRKDFLEEGRWQVIASGLLVTAVISFCAIAFGVPLALLLVWLRYGGNRLATWLINIFMSLMTGVPIVVVLMVLYYVVFGGINIAGEVVCAAAFILSLAGRGAAIIWQEVENVPKNQIESGLALGYTPRQVFMRVVIPRAAMPFSSRIADLCVNVVKETSVVGYIAVQDLTRASDFIRARTMDAFFPLVATTIVYFVICRALGWVFGKISSRYLALRKDRRLRGLRDEPN